MKNTSTIKYLLLAITLLPLTLLAANSQHASSGNGQNMDPWQDRFTGNHGNDNKGHDNNKLDRLFKRRIALPVRPDQRIVDFRQLVFEFGSSSIKHSDWGLILVDRRRLAKHFGTKPVYLNVFYPAGDSSGRALWIVDNLYIPATPVKWRRQTGKVSRYIDLKPDVDNGRGAVSSTNAIVLVSRQALPFASASLDFAEQVTDAQRFAVRSILENTGGDLGENVSPGSTRPPSGEFLSIGQPPQPTSPPFEPQLDLLSPIAVYQQAAPNIQAAKNQCVPMAHANVIQYLENKINIAPLSWNLPEAAIPGIGHITSNGDVIFWEPIPENSVIAHVDTRTTRNGVFDPDSGSGSNRCQNIRGVMGYLTQNNLTANFRHQGGSALYGFGGSCDSTVFSDVGELNSVREGAAPTWQWIFDQLVQGRGVSISYGRYDNDGERTSGHMLRVWGASDLNGSRYLHLLDDGNQGSNNAGLQLRQFNVADTSGPGMPGIPDGQLNIDGGNSEIEFAISIQTLPTLSLP